VGTLDLWEKIISAVGSLIGFVMGTIAFIVKWGNKCGMKRTAMQLRCFLIKYAPCFGLDNPQHTVVYKPVSKILVGSDICIRNTSDIDDAGDPCSCPIGGIGNHYKWECPEIYQSVFGECPGWDRKCSRIIGAWDNVDEENQKLKEQTKVQWGNFIKYYHLKSKVRYHTLDVDFP
jgi:hypothetical protein